MSNQTNHKGNLTEEENKELEEWAWVPFDGWKGLHYTKYASDILNYRPLFGKELNSTKILILIKLWENKTKKNTTYHTSEILGIAAGINPTLVSTYIQEMSKSELECSLCGEKFGILEIIGEHKYETGKTGNLYSLEKIENLLIHITNAHKKPNPKRFYEYIVRLNKHPKAKITWKQELNLSQNKGKI